MSLTFDADNDSDPSANWDIAFLSDRDVSSQVPINFVPQPGIHVTPACFGDGVYNTAATQTCLSNLLASQIRRYVFDLYWDTSNRRFGFCPVELPKTTSTTSSQLSGRSETVAPPFDNLQNIDVRQISSSRSVNATASSTISRTSTSSAATSLTTNVNEQGIFQLGPYRCSSDLTLDSVASLFKNYLDSTANTLEAKINVWILNLHVAATYDAPTEARANLSYAQLPATNEMLSTYFGTLASALYDPNALLSDRANLNASWFRESARIALPLTEYFTLRKLDNGDFATDDGWPDETYIQVSRGNRMLVGFGKIDDQLAGYNTTADRDRIYGPNILLSPSVVSYNSSGQLTSGCFYNPSKFDVAQINNSWATATINNVDPPDLNAVADNLTVCGISPILNATINNALANTSPVPYQNFGNQALFSWAYGQPLNDSSVAADGDAKFRCALMVSSDAYRGHWIVEYCSKSHRVACREANEPYRWRVSSYSVPYGSGDAACTGNTTFDVPRTGLENTYLYRHVLNDAQADDELLSGVWINFNSLDVENCWVTTGENGTCPYYRDTDATQSRQILIPTIAALIVLVLTVLTIVVKCTTNRRNSRARKRGEGGWDYEGVPS